MLKCLVLHEKHLEPLFICRGDAHVANLRIAAFETLMELIKNSPKDCYEVVQKTTLVVLKKLEQLLNMENQIESSSHKVFVENLNVF